VEPDYYAVLGVAPSATPDEIKAAYRELARTMHPDKRPDDPKADEKFAAINQAAVVLKDKKKRAEYDAARQPKSTQAQRPAGSAPVRKAPGADPGNRESAKVGPQITRDSPLGDLLGGFAAGNFGRPQVPNRPGSRPPHSTPDRETESSSIPIQVSVEEAYSGARLNHSVDQRGTCPNCKGAGSTPGSLRGMSVGRSRCEACMGKGTVRRTESVVVRIAAGVRNGTKVRVRDVGPTRSDGTRGDLIFEVRLKPSARFRVEGGEIHVEVGVPYPILVLGGETRAPTPAGSIALKVPPYTPDGAVISIPGGGMPAVGSQQAGALHAKLRVEVPRSVNDEERRLLVALLKQIKP
jgi:molecular chaperone DnaJ